jgi:hypothetical protein
LALLSTECRPGDRIEVRKGTNVAHGTLTTLPFI